MDLRAKYVFPTAAASVMYSTSKVLEIVLFPWGLLLVLKWPLIYHAFQLNNPSMTGLF